MRRRGQGLLALVLVALALVGASAAARLGPASPTSGGEPTVRSGEWLCPHGGGEGWTAEVVVTNPGDRPVQARVSALGPDAKPEEPVTLTVAAGAQLRREVPAAGPDSATYVEVFGGWASASWLLRAAEPDVGLGAEACAPAGAQRWLTTESTTQEGEHAFLVVMNPYASGAVFDVTLHQPDEPPLRDPDWSDIELRAGRATALRLDAKVVGKDTVAAIVDVRAGRVAVATLGVTEGGGVRSVLGATAEADTWATGTAWGTGQARILVLVPGENAVRFGAVLRSSRAPQTAGGLVDVRQTSLSTQAYPVIADGPSSIEVQTADGALVVAALRADGQSDDDAATAGASRASTAWIVPPTVGDEPAFSDLILANPGEAPIDATLTLLGVDGPGATRTVTVPAGGTATVDEDFREADPRASVLVLGEGPLFATAAATSGGVRGLSLYALASGTPIPAWAVPSD
ncbi:MAG TPA: DUF5719 family protein [Actinomycetota bacterium]